MIELSAEEADVLRRLLRSLKGAESEFIVAGGQAARLLRLHPLARPLEWSPLLTHDVDVATQDKGHRSVVDVGAALISEGFTARLDGDDAPPLTHYVFGNSEIEFIVPDVARRNPTGATVSVLGASAQKVANLEPLMVEPTELSVPGVGVVRVPNPAAYLIQKVITLTARRTLGKKGKDALYAHDGLQLFTHGTRLHADVVAQAGRVLETLTRKQHRKLIENADKLGDANTDFVVEASRLADGRPGLHTAQAIALANRLGLGELLSRSSRK